MTRCSRLTTWNSLATAPPTPLTPPADSSPQGWSDVSWLIGGDSVANLPTWHEADALLNLIQFVVMARPGWALPWETLPAALQPLRHQVVRAPLIDISATDIRERIRVGQPIDYLLPQRVIQYIECRGLYLG